MTLVILDTETTGLEPDDHIWELAAIRLDSGAEPVRWHVFVRHDLAKTEALPESFRADHDTRYDPAAAVTPRELAVDILPRLFAGRPHIIGAVPNFDTERLSRLLRHHGQPGQPWHYHLCDVETLAKGWLYGRASLGDAAALAELANADDSDALSRAVGVEPPGEGVRHTAMGAGAGTLAVWRAITGQEAPASPPQAALAGAATPAQGDTTPGAPGGPWGLSAGRRGDVEAIWPEDGLATENEVTWLTEQVRFAAEQLASLGEENGRLLVAHDEARAEAERAEAEREAMRPVVDAAVAAVRGLRGLLATSCGRAGRELVAAVDAAMGKMPDGDGARAQRVLDAVRLRPGRVDPTAPAMDDGRAEVPECMIRSS